MTNLKIYRLAWYQLLKQIEQEQNLLKKHPNNKICIHKLQKLNNEEKFVHNLILKEEETTKESK